MGEPAAMKAWIVRALLLAALMSSVSNSLRQEHEDPQLLLQRAGQVFRQAGYHTTLVSAPAWGQQTRAAELTLMARSPLCGADVKVQAVSLANLADDFQSTALHPGTSYAFVDWSGLQVSRVHLLIEIARLRLRGAFSFGQSHWVRSALLVIEDPCACMAIVPAPTAQVWSGS